MSVFLTPDLKPFVGGTYFPPKDSLGRPGFSTILKSIAERWKSDREKLVHQGNRILAAISEAVSVSGGNQGLPGTDCIQRGYEMLEKRFDSKYDGYGNAPKFPQPSEQLSTGPYLTLLVRDICQKDFSFGVFTLNFRDI